MARFDLYRVDLWRIPLMVDVQSDLLDEMVSRVVIPLRPAEDEPKLPRLKPVIRVDERDFILVTPEISAQPCRWLGRPVGNIAEHRDTITAAMDFLFDGY